jgi:hypothetical protein
MDPKSTAKPTILPACPEATDPQTEIWEPPFERWQRLTEALIRNAEEAAYRLSALRRTS